MSPLMTDKLIAENVNDLIFCVLIRSFFFLSLSLLNPRHGIRYISGYLGWVQFPMSQRLLKEAEDTLCLEISWIQCFKWATQLLWKGAWTMERHSKDFGGRFSLCAKAFPNPTAFTGTWVHPTLLSLRPQAVLVNITERWQFRPPPLF